MSVRSSQAKLRMPKLHPKSGTSSSGAIPSVKKEWLEACIEVSDAKREAKQEQWIEVVGSAISDLDERNMWKFIKSLNGSPSTNSTNEAMEIGNKTVVSARKKAEAFAKHYAKDFSSPRANLVC